MAILHHRGSGSFEQGLSEKYPGIEVSYFPLKDDQRDERYFLEHDAGKHIIDIGCGHGLKTYKEKGLVADISELIKDTGFSKESSTKDLMGIGFDHSLLGVVYNTNLVSSKDAPRTYEDLLNPKWKGKIAFEQSCKLFIIATESWGEENIVTYLRKLREQKPVFENGGTQLPC